MSNGLDKYLQAVAHELRGLEAEQRESELREMRGHLEAIVARLMEGGASEEEAVSAAIAQFGAARAVGRELKASGKKGEPWWRAWAGSVGAVMLYLTLLHYAIAVTARLLTSARLGSPEFYLALRIPEVVFFIAPVAAGFLAGCVSPRRGGRALLGLCGGTCGIVSVCLGLGLTEWRSLAVAGVTLLLVWLGALAGSRAAGLRSQRRLDGQQA